jgi:hypothetical protein
VRRSSLIHRKTERVLSSRSFARRTRSAGGLNSRAGPPSSFAFGSLFLATHNYARRSRTENRNNRRDGVVRSVGDTEPLRESPSPPRSTSDGHGQYFLVLRSCCTIQLKEYSVWRAWTPPGRWISLSNYDSIEILYKRSRRWLASPVVCHLHVTRNVGTESRLSLVLI